MEIEDLRNNVLSVLKAVLSDRDYAHFVLKVVGGMNNSEIARATKQSETNIRRRWTVEILEALSTNTGYKYEGEELIDTTEEGQFIRTTARFRNARKFLLRQGYKDDGDG